VSVLIHLSTDDLCEDIKNTSKVMAVIFFHFFQIQLHTVRLHLIRTWTSFLRWLCFAIDCRKSV